MKTLRQTLQQAESDAVAIGHFNISDLVGLKAAFDSARELSVPVGDIGSGSEIHDLAGDSRLTTPAEAKQFVTETRVDTLAPAVGNRHGMSKAMAAGETRKRLNIEQIREIKAATHVFMTLHGASGTDDNDLRQAIAAGMTVVHINTEVRLAWRRGFDDAFAKQPTETVPYKILPDVVDTIKDVVKSRLGLFNSGQTQMRSASERG